MDGKGSFDALGERPFALARDGKGESSPAATRLRLLFRSPFLWILTAVLALRLVGIAWGLPASDGWDDDGIAPRDFLVGTAYTYWPGQFFTYPPVHLLLLTLLTLPASLVAVARAPSLAAPDLIAEFIRVPYMTTFAIAARLVTAAMSIGIVLALAAFAREVRGRSASYWVAGACSVNAVFTYYSHTTNLDVPYLFWSCLSLLFFARAMARREPRWLRWAFVLAALAIGTKDQAYALFVLAVPAAMLLWLTTDDWAREHRSEIGRELAKSVAVALGILLLVDGALVNPSGFAARLRFLVGPASQNHAGYAKTMDGTLLVVRDSILHFTRYYPAAFAPLVLAGVAVSFRREGSSGGRVARYLPLLFAISFTIAFNCVARRTEHRFLLPQMMLIGVYAGFAIDTLIALAGTWRRRLVYPLLAVAFAVAMFECLAVDAALLLDPRYDAEKWVATHVNAADVIETYGNNVYLPRFPESARVTRVGPEPPETRSPLPGVAEVQDEYGAVARRRPKWIIVSEAWVWRYMFDQTETGKGGPSVSNQLLAWHSDAAACRYFKELHQGQRGYHLAHLAGWQSSVWPRVDIHSSTTREIRIFERDDDQLGGNDEWLLDERAIISGTP